VLGAIGQFERSILLERQREGVAKAKAESKYKGRAPTARAKAPEVKQLRQAGIRPADIARRLGISRVSVYRVLG
jgi:DNA invertase Pin-like site-specific DNA recombinase